MKKAGRALAWLAVGAWHGGLLAALWSGQRSPASGASPVTTPLAVRLLNEKPVSQGRAVLPAPPPAWRPPDLPWVAPPSFVVESESRGVPPPIAAPVMSALAPLPAPVPAPASARPVPDAQDAEPLQPARRAACAPAPHPVLLRERGIEGVVRLRVWVDELGRAGQVMLAASSGWRLFDDAAMAQARRCPFHPAQRGAQPVGSWVEFPVRFALETSNG